MFKEYQAAYDSQDWKTARKILTDLMEKHYGDVKIRVKIRKAYVELKEQDWYKNG